MEQTCVNEYAFPALSLDVYVPHTGLVFHVVYQQNCTQGCTGHIIIKLKYYSYHYSYLLPLLSGSTLGSFLLVSIFVRPDLQLWKSITMTFIAKGEFISLVLVFQTLESTMHWINHHQVDKYQENQYCIYPLNKDLSSG